MAVAHLRPHPVLPPLARGQGPINLSGLVPLTTHLVCLYW